MKLLIFSPFNFDAATVINRSLPLLHELAKNSIEVDVVFPAHGNDNFYIKFDMFNYTFLNPPGARHGLVLGGSY